MASREVEFIIKMRNEANAVLKAVSGDLQKTGAAASQAATGLDKTSAGLRNVERNAAGTKNALSRLGVDVRSVTRLLAPLTAALSIGALLREASDQTLRFSESMARLEGLSGLASGEIDELRSSLLGLVNDTGRKPAELAEGIELIVRSGQRGAEALDTLRKAAEASTIGLGTTRDVASVITGVLNSYAGTGLTAARATDILTATVANSRGQAEELTKSLGKLAPQASLVGVNFEQVGGAISALTQRGVPAEKAVAGLEAVFDALNRRSEQSEEVLKFVGTSFEQITRSVRERGLITTLQDLNDRLGGSEKALTQLLGSGAAVSEVMALTGENAGKAAVSFDKVANSTGKTSEAFKKVVETDAKKLEIAFNSIDSTLVKLGSATLPTVATSLQLLTGDFSFFSKSVGDGVTQGELFGVALDAIASAARRLFSFDFASGNKSLFVEEFEKGSRALIESKKVAAEAAAAQAKIVAEAEAAQRRAQAQQDGLTASTKSGTVATGSNTQAVTGNAEAVDENTLARRRFLAENAATIIAFNTSIRAIQDETALLRLNVAERERATFAAKLSADLTAKGITDNIERARIFNETLKARDELASAKAGDAVTKAVSDATEDVFFLTKDLNREHERELELIGRSAKQVERIKFLRETEDRLRSAGISDEQKITAEVEKQAKLFDQRIAAKLANSGDALAGARTGVEEFIDQADDLNTKFKEFSTTTLQEASDALTEFALTGKFDMESFTASVLRNLQDIASQKIIGELGKSLFDIGGATGGGGGSGDTFGALLQGVSALFLSKGGMVGRGGTRATVPAAAFVGAPRFAGGGRAFGRGRDTVPAILSPGEIVLNQAQQRNVAAGMGGTPVQVTMNISTPDATSFKRSQSQIGASTASAIGRAQRRNG